MGIEKKDCKVGLRVQNNNGEIGTVRWIGRIEKAAKPPNMDVGTYAAIEFDLPTQALNRTDGEWSGTRYCKCPPGTVEFHKPRVLDVERNVAGIAAVRGALGERVTP